MNDNPESHEFDWITARDRCSLPKEFHHLMEFVDENCKARKRCTPDHHPYDYEFLKKDSDNFFVRRTEIPDGLCVVEFSLKNDKILVGGSDSDPPWKVKLTLTLNDSGSCRFKINGHGEYMRWQVAMRALSPLFFDEPRAPADHNE